MRWNPYLWEVDHGPPGKSPIIVLNEQSNKRTPLPTYCYTHTEVYHWVSPERQLLAVDGSQLDKMQRVKDWTLTSKWDHTLIIIKALPPKAQRSMREPEVVDDSTITVFSRHSRSDAHMNPQRLWHKFKPDKFPAKRRASGHIIQLLP